MLIILCSYDFLLSIFFLMKKGLVHRAVLLSGSALSPWALIPDPDVIREEVSQQMACHLVADINTKIDRNSRSGNNPATTISSSSGSSNNNKQSPNDITECLRSKPLEALKGIRLPDVR